MPTFQVWLTNSEATKLAEIANANGETSEAMLQEFIRGRLKKVKA